MRDKGLTTKDVLRVKTQKGIISPELTMDGRVTVDMGAPVFALADIPFDPRGTQPVASGAWQKWPVALAGIAQAAPYLVATVSMGNPHAVLLVDDVDAADVARLGPAIQQSGYFPQGVNVGFLQVISRSRVALRVYERGVGETLACGTGSCAAVVAGIRLGLLDARVDVQTRGGVLTIAWDGAQGDLQAPVRMTGPATTVFQGVIDLPDSL